MITTVATTYFKKFEDETFRLPGNVVLAGPNNSGKTSLLQAIVVWNLALHRWTEKRGPRSTAKERTGVPITRKDFTPLPLREIDLLWTDTDTAKKSSELMNGEKAGHPRVLTICLEGKSPQRWKLGFEFRRQSVELVYVKPTQDSSHNDVDMVKKHFAVVHVPPFSGIGSEETRYDHPYQDLLIGQGKPGDILRNLLYEVYERDDGSWKKLCSQIKEIFGFTLEPPEYAGLPYILCQYSPNIARDQRKKKFPRFDVASAGSGFQQVLMLLGFFYARPSTVLLLDEPDAHLHIILQKQIYDMIRRVASERHCQLIIATHAEVLIDNTSPTQILSFFHRPHLLVEKIERKEVHQALRELNSTDMMLAESTAGVLYLENTSDLDILRAMANVLNHPLSDWFKDCPFWKPIQGSDPRNARRHFFALRAIKKDITGVLILDGDNRKSVKDHEVSAKGLNILRWKRYEIESYIFHPDVLHRFVEAEGGQLFALSVDKYLKDEVPPVVLRDPLASHDWYESTPISKQLLPNLFTTIALPLEKKEYYRIAEKMKRGEIPNEVHEKLNEIARQFRI